MSLNVAIYIRVSTEEQAREGYSIAAQKERLTQFALSQDWIIEDFYVDEGISAKDTNRPQLQRMLKNIEEKKINVVLVYKLDRLTRSLLDLFQLLQFFDKQKVGFKSATEVFDTTTAIGRLFIAIVGAMAQWERENTAERVRFGMEQLVMQGKYHGGHIPYGYDFADGKMSINKEQAEVVRYMFQRFLLGEGDQKIARSLNAQGLTTSSNTPWIHTTIGYMLKNPIYKGSTVYNKKSKDPKKYIEVDGIFPAIVSEEIWEQAQVIRDSRKVIHPRAKVSEYAFAGRLRCARCGSSMRGNRDHKAKKPDPGRYICPKRKSNACDMPNVNIPNLEWHFLEAMKRIRDEVSAKEVAASVELDTDLNNEIRNLQNEIQRLKKNREKWQRAYAADVITLEELGMRTGEDRKKEEEYQEMLANLTSRQSGQRITQDELTELLSDFETNWMHATIQEKKTIIQTMFENIYVDTDYDKKKRAGSRLPILTISFDFM